MEERHRQAVTAYGTSSLGKQSSLFGFKERGSKSGNLCCSLGSRSRTVLWGFGGNTEGIIGASDKISTLPLEIV